MSQVRGFYFLRKSANDAPTSDWTTFDEIERLLKKRKIDQNWLVRRGGDTEWVTIAELLGNLARGDRRLENSPAVSFACIKCRVQLRIWLRFDGTVIGARTAERITDACVHALQLPSFWSSRQTARPRRSVPERFNVPATNSRPK